MGLDISTSIIGVCFLTRNTSKLIHLNCIKLTSTKFTDLWEKVDFAKVELEKLCQEVLNPHHSVNYPVYRTFSRIFVEENAKRFSPGFSSADTILTLAKMNGIMSYLARNIANAPVIDVNVTSARSKLGLKIDRTDKSKTVKEKVFEKNVLLHPEFPWPQHLAKTGKHIGQVVYNVEARDMSDAYVICAGGKIIHA